MARIPNNQCETIAVGTAARGDVIRFKSFVPAWDDQSDRAWEDREYPTRSNDHVVLHAESFLSQGGRRATRYYRLTIMARNDFDAGLTYLRSVTLSSSTRLLRVPETVQLPN